MKRVSIVLGAVPLLLASSAIASQDVVFRQEVPPGGGGQQMRFQMPNFAELDKNKDKKISRDEVGQMPPQFFDRLDENKDGFIDEEEWNRRMRGGGPGGPRIGEQLSKFLDANGDGKISREEFARVTQLFDSLDRDHNAELSTEEMNRFFEAVRDVQAQATGGVDVNSLFVKFDKDKDGKLTVEELGSERTFKSLDANHDGFVTKEEADKAVRQMAEKQKSQPSQQPAPPKTPQT